MAGKGITDPSKVTAVMLANAYRKVVRSKIAAVISKSTYFLYY